MRDAIQKSLTPDALERAVSRFEEYISGHGISIAGSIRNAVVLDPDQKLYVDQYSQEILSYLHKPESLKNVIDSDASDEMTAAMLLFASTVGWSITDEPDNPWRSAAASLLPRSIEEIRRLLINLATGVFQSDLSILDGLPDADLQKIRAALDSKPLWVAEMDIVFPTPPPQANGAGVTWKEIGVHVDYERMAAATIDKWYKRGILSVRGLSAYLRNGNSIPLIDRTLLKLNGMRTYA
jgi:hypothetical protein